MDEAKNSGHWPENCCVPAFLGTAVGILSGNLGLLDDEQVRRRLARVTGVTVGPHDPNPWGLPVAHNVEDLGVNPQSISGPLGSIEAAMMIGQNFRLEITPLNTIPFQLYEDALLDMYHAGAVVGISFDYAELAHFQGRVLSSANTFSHARHVVRLTPHGDSEFDSSTVASRDFRADYPGSLCVFDDSGEMGSPGVSVNWLHLTRASSLVEGGYWSVWSSI